MNLQNVLEALKSCGYEPESYGYNKTDMSMEKYYTENSRYYHEQPDNPDRPKKIVTEEYDSEKRFILRWLTHIALVNRKHNNLVIACKILKALCKTPTRATLAVIHSQIFEIYTKEDREDDQWKFYILAKPNELFNSPYAYGIGFINGEYVVEQQDVPSPGDNPSIYHSIFHFNSFFDAIEKLKSFAKKDILHREVMKERKIIEYKCSDIDKQYITITQDIINAYCGSYKPNLSILPKGQQFVQIKHTNYGYSAIFVDTERGYHEYVQFTEKSIQRCIERIFLKYGKMSGLTFQKIKENEAVSQLLSKITEETYGIEVYSMLQQNNII